MTTTESIEQAARLLKSSDWTFEVWEKANESHLKECIRRIESKLKVSRLEVLQDLIEEREDVMQQYMDEHNITNPEMLTPEQIATMYADTIGWAMLGDFWCYESTTFHIVIF